MRSFRFACRATGGQARTAKEWCELALRAEDLGYDTFGVSDHFATAYAPLVLQLVASCTSRLRLATLVLNNDFRHPAVVTKEAATLDLLSGGRLELGMGAGWQPRDYERSEHPVRPGPGPRRTAARIAAVLKRLFGDAPATMAGRHLAVRGLSGVPAPMQRPHPPLMVGGTGPRLLRMAAEEADIVRFDSGPATTAPSTWSLSALAEKARLVREAAQSSDVELHLNPDVWAVGANRRQVVHAAARDAGVDADRLDRSAYVLAGTAEQGDRALGDRARSYGDLVRIDSVGPDRRVRAGRRNSPRSLTVATSGCGRTGEVLGATRDERVADIHMNATGPGAGCPDGVGGVAMTRGRDGGGKARGDGVPGVALVAGVGDEFGQPALALGEQADQDRDGVAGLIRAAAAMCDQVKDSGLRDGA